jgi:quercetin dioxygenase-like cupin family protein
MQRKDLILTDHARVAVIDLAAGEESPWHFHSAVTENVICLSGTIKLQYGQEGACVVLLPGERHEIPLGVGHSLVNMHGSESTYLLVQEGQYDFVPGSARPAS